MLLLAVAVVFFGLAWHSAASGGDDPEKELAEAGAKLPAASLSPSVAATTSSSATTTKAPSLCVFNAGTVAGLAGDVATELEGKGFTVSEPANLTTDSITENTIFYDSGDRSAAQRVSKALGGSVSVEARPDVFTECPDGMPVIVVTR